MKLYSDLLSTPVQTKPCFVTLGLFDGVHLGHQHLLSTAKREAVSHGAALVVITFTGLPRAAQDLITTPAHKKVLLEAFGADIVVELPFSKRIQSLSPEKFLSLVEKMFPSSRWVVGKDVHFGSGGEGNLAFLTQHAREEVVVVEPLSRERLSSTHIRRCIKGGDFARASSLLGRPYSIYGKSDNGVIDGKDLCLPPVGTWNTILRTHSINGLPENIGRGNNSLHTTETQQSEDEFLTTCTISKEKTCHLELPKKQDFPDTFVEVLFLPNEEGHHE